MTGNYTSHATYGGSLVAVIGGMTLHEILAAGGLVLAIAGLATNFIFLWREDRRETERLAREARDRATGDRQAGDGR